MGLEFTVYLGDLSLKRSGRRRQRRRAAGERKSGGADDGGRDAAPWREGERERGMTEWGRKEFCTIRDFISHLLYKGLWTK